MEGTPEQMQINAETIGKQFVDFYYQVFDADRSQLASLYNANAQLKWEGKQIFGGSNVVQHLKDLPFKALKHKIQEIDIQLMQLPGSEAFSILVSVGGLLLIDDGDNPLQFGRIFVLNPDGGSFFVINDIFRLHFPGM